MPTVPTYRGPQLRSQALEGGFQQATGNDGAFGGVQARQLQDVGRGVSQLGAGLQQLAERRTLENAFAIENQIAEQWDQYKTRLLQERQGERAAGAREDADAWWLEIQQKYDQELDPATKRALSRSLGRMRVNALGNVGRFEADQLDRVGQVNFEAAQLREQREATSFAVAGNDAELNVSLQKITQATREYLVRRGMPTEAIDEEVRKRVANVHAEAITTLMLTDPKRAREYFNRPGVQEGFTRGQRAEIGERLARVVDGEEGAQGAREVFDSAMTGKNYHEAVPYDQLDAQLVERFQGRPEALRGARAELDRRVQLWNRTQTEQQAAGVNGAFDLLNRGVPLSRIQASPAWQQMSPQQRDQFKEMLDNRWRQAQARSDADRERAARMEEERTAEATLIYSDPATLARLTRDELMALRPALGERNFQQLLRAWDGYQRDTARLSNASFDNDMFNEIMLAAGYNPRPKSGDRRAAATVIRARSAIDQALAAEQLARRRDLTSVEKREIAQGVINARVMIDRPWFVGDRETALFEADPQEVVERGFILVGPDNRTRLRVSDIPPQDFADMKRFLRETGQPNDDVTVMRRWYEFQQTRQRR